MPRGPPVTLHDFFFWTPDLLIESPLSLSLSVSFSFLVGSDPSNKHAARPNPPCFFLGAASLPPDAVTLTVYFSSCARPSSSRESDFSALFSSPAHLLLSFFVIFPPTHRFPGNGPSSLRYHIPGKPRPQYKPFFRFLILKYKIGIAPPAFTPLLLTSTGSHARLAFFSGTSPESFFFQQSQISVLLLNRS